MRLIHILALPAVVLASACQQPKPQQLAQIPKYDTLQTIQQTDTGNFRQLRMVIGTLETINETQRIISPDSIVPHRRTAFGYDSLGNKVLSIESIYDAAMGEYVHLSRREAQYDALHNPVEVTYSIEKLNRWQPTHREVFEYDQRKNITAREFYEYDHGKFVIRRKAYHKYDNRNNEVETILYTADTLGVWSPVSKVVQEYNDDNLPAVITTMKPARNNQWTTDTKVEHSYNVKNERVSSIAYISRGGKWVYNVLSEYTYSPDGTMTSIRSSFWDDAAKRWKFQKEEKL